MPARLDKYLQIICKSWPISTVFNLCHILKWKTGGENAWKIIVSPLHLRPPWSIHLPRFYILEARVLRPLYGLLGESSCRFVGLLCWPQPVALILHQSKQCSRPACTSPPTLPSPSPSSEKMVLAKLFALLSLYQLPSLVQSTVLRGGEQISDY